MAVWFAKCSFILITVLMDFQVWLHGQCVRQDKRLFNLNCLEIKLVGGYAFLEIKKEYTSFDLFCYIKHLIINIWQKRDHLGIFSTIIIVARSPVQNKKIVLFTLFAMILKESVLFKINATTDPSQKWCLTQNIPYKILEYYFHRFLYYFTISYANL